MLRTNLSTKPFYNERLLHLVLGLVGAMAIALTIFNVTQIAGLSRQQADLTNRAMAAERQAQDLRAQAAAVRRGLNPAELRAVAAAAGEANLLINRRLFSWTDLLNRLETTLPDAVRITAMRPDIDRNGTITIYMTVVGRRVEDIDQFMESLEATSAFADVLSREEISRDDGLRQASIEGRYTPK